MTESLLPALQNYLTPVISASITIALVLLVFYSLKRALGRVTTQGYLDYHLSMIFQALLRFLFVVVCILLILGYFGLSVSTLWATLSGVLALIAVGFVAVWSVVSNVFCSVLLILFPPFRIGDEIEIQDTGSDFTIRGRVTGINMFNTSLTVAATRERPEEHILKVPNNIFFQKYIRRFQGESTQSLQGYVAEQAELKKESRAVELTAGQDLDN